MYEVRAWGALALIACWIGSSLSANASDVEFLIQAKKPYYEQGEAFTFQYTVPPFEYLHGDGSEPPFAYFKVHGFYNKDEHFKYMRKMPVGAGIVSIPTEDLRLYADSSDYEPYRGRTSYSLGRFSSVTHKFDLFVRRPIPKAPNGFISVEKNRYQVGENITVNVSSDIGEFIRPFVNDNNENEVAALMLVQLPREVPGGSWIPSHRNFGFGKLGFYEKVRRDGGAYTLLKGLDSYPGSSNIGTVPPGHYAIYLMRDWVVIDEKFIEIVAPEREELDIIRLYPEEDAEDDKPPLYDTPPKITFDKDALPESLQRYGVVRLFRVGRHGSLRLVNEREIHCGDPSGGESASIECDFSNEPNGEWTLYQGVGLFGRPEGSPAPAGTYEVRFYYRRDPLGFDYNEWDFVLDSKRFTLGNEAVEELPQNASHVLSRWWEHNAEPIPDEAFELKADKESPVQMREIVQVEIANGEAADDMDEAPWDTLKEDVWVSLHRMGGYTLNCAYYEEEGTYGTNVVKLKDAIPLPLPDGITNAMIPTFNMPEPLAIPVIPPQPVIRMNDDYGVGITQDGLSTQGNKSNVRPFVKKEGERKISVAMPPIPGRYELRLYRGDFKKAQERFPDGELLASKVFEVEAKHLGQAIAFPSDKIVSDQRFQIRHLNVPKRRKDYLSSFYIKEFATREEVPGGAKTTPMWEYDIEGILSEVGSAEPAQTAKLKVKDKNYRQLFLMSNGIIMGESKPALVYNPEFPAEQSWPDALMPSPIGHFNDLKIAVDDWMMPPGMCGELYLPEHEIRLVEWIPGEIDEQLDYEGPEYGYEGAEFDLIDGEEDEYEELDDVYMGHPFYIEAVFDTVPEIAKYYGRIGKKTRVLFKRDDEDPTIYRSEDMYVVTEKGVRALR